MYQNDDSDLLGIINEFTFRLQHNNAQLALCGVNLVESLLLAANTFDGKSRQEILSAIGLPDGSQKQALQRVKQLLGDIKRDGRVQSTSSIWHRRGKTIDPHAMEELSQFGAHLALLDEQAINSHIHSSTNGKISASVEVTDDTVLLLVSCLYFQASWLSQFDSISTESATFHTFQEGSQPCRMMKKEWDWPYYEDDRLQALRMPYGQPNESSTDGPGWAAVFMLPKDSDPEAWQESVSSVMASAGSWRRFLEQFREQLVDASIPRFRVRNDEDVCAALQGMGVKELFSPASLDFCIGTPPREEAWVSQISHMTCLECNEQGTEMAAATVLEEIDGISDVEFVADRPFWFVLVDQRTGLILYSAMVERLGGEDIDS